MDMTHMTFLVPQSARLQVCRKLLASWRQLRQELLSSEACPPVWYCSHWWGEPIRDFVNCCQEHANVRRLGDQGSYWVCD